MGPRLLSFILICLAAAPSVSAQHPDLAGSWRSSTGAWVRVSPGDDSGEFGLVAVAKGQELFRTRARWEQERTFVYSTPAGERIQGEVGPDGAGVRLKSPSWSAEWSRPGPRQLAEALYQPYGGRNTPDISKTASAFQHDLETELARLLVEIAGRGYSPDHAWLDFDPFINGQMNAATVRFGGEAAQGDLVKIPVFISYRAPGHEQHAVTVVLRRTAPRWRIANFVYPARDGSPSWDLLGWLREQLKSRGGVDPAPSGQGRDHHLDGFQG